MHVNVYNRNGIFYPHWSQQQPCTTTPGPISRYGYMYIQTQS